jgi:D-alanine-D-alanine ligase
MIRVGLVFGGRSAEHEVSIMTAKEIYKAIDKDKFTLKLFGIDKDGYWEQMDNIPTNMLSIDNFLSREDKMFIKPNIVKTIQTEIDVVFILLHGPYGEDGKIQGFFDMIGKPYVGADLISSALCMDKGYTKLILDHYDIPQVPYKIISKYDSYDIKSIKEKFSLPVFIKPANMGSSVGITKVKDWDKLINAIEEAHKFDTKVIIEQGIEAREIECAILGNEEMIVSHTGEIIPSHEFYDYEAKYFDDGKSKLIIPAPIDTKYDEKIRTYAISATRALGVEGMARIDFFLQKDTNNIYLNELNSIPGFTPFSMYPNLLMEEGYSYTSLLTKLVELAIEKV